MARNKVNVAAEEERQHDTRDYLYSVVWSEEDKAFIGRVLEFPSLAAHGSTQAKALSEIRSVVQNVFDDLVESGEEVPEPLNRWSYSGKLNVRLPKYLHRQLAIEAAEEGVSLNQLITTKLAATGWLNNKPSRSKIRGLTKRQV
jgi:predicted HicB family RNase H-like nuclease